MNSVKDQLSWEQLKIHSINAKKPIKKISEFNRLIAHSKNFLISGYGAFTNGYILIISKTLFLHMAWQKKMKLMKLNF